MKNIWTIEINMDDDFSSCCAYHIDYLEITIKRNLLNISMKHKTENWCIVALANNYEEAHDKAKEIQLILCEANNRNPHSGLEEFFNRMEEEKYG